MEIDYIIVGQGLAGTILSYSLLKKQKKIIVIDNSHVSSSSIIAAGLFNPVVFKRLVKSWKADELFPFADIFYKEAESFLGERFYYKKEIVKLFAENHERDFWEKQSKLEIGKYLSDNIKTDFFPDFIRNPVGCSEVKFGGNLDVPKFIGLFKAFLTDKKLLIQEKFDFNELKDFKSYVEYKNINAKKIIFCEGYKAIENPYFNWLPFKLTKGEILTLKINNFNVEQIINKGVFILPLGNELFKVGATYQWDEINETITNKGKEELVEKLEKVIKVPYQIVNHQAGVRPTVKDRRPLIGMHPTYKAIGIFNGMGTKGVMLTPYFANNFIDFLEKEIPLDKEVDIKRYYVNFSESSQLLK